MQRFCGRFWPTAVDRVIVIIIIIIDALLRSQLQGHFKVYYW